MASNNTSQSRRHSIWALNSTGRQISLLNEDARAHSRRPYPTPSHHPGLYAPGPYYAPSNQPPSPVEVFFSAPGSPSTPPLLRSDSYDSAFNGDPISPLTPSNTVFDFPHHNRPLASPAPPHVNNSIYPDPEFASQNQNLYTPYPSAPPKPSPLVTKPRPTLTTSYTTTSYTTTHHFPTSASPFGSHPSIPSSSSSLLSRSGTTSPAPASRTARLPPAPPPTGTGSAKRYPCRFAHTHGCNKTFTTSGHASRHSKIHTAEKGVKCSFVGCAKRFTRADNMKQHLETHFKERGKGRTDVGRGNARFEERIGAVMDGGVGRRGKWERVSREGSVEMEGRFRSARERERERTRSETSDMSGLDALSAAAVAVQEREE